MSIRLLEDLMTHIKRNVGRSICIAILLTAAILMIRACSMDLPRLLDRLAVDDTFLYLQIARNVAHGQGPTFDGLHATNGFQPLWLLVTLPLGVLFRQPESFFRACLYLCALCNLGTLWLLYRIGLRLGGRSIALPLMAGFLWVLTIWKPFLSGMETSLYLLVFATFLNTLLKRRPSTLWMSVLAGLLILCRVDAVLFVLGGFLSYRPLNRKTASGLLLPLAIIAAPYFIWNLVSFESPLPVSGGVKAVYHKQELGNEYLRTGHAEKTLSVYAPKAVLSMASRFTAPLERTFRRRFTREAVWACLLGLGALMLARPGRTKLILLALFGFLHGILITASIGRFSSMAWYYAPQILLVVLGLSIGLSTAYRPIRRWAFAPAVFFGFGIMVFVFWSGWASLTVMPEKNDLYQRRYRLALWMNNHLSADAVVGSWNAGQLAFFSDRTVVNLDGLVNDQHYLRRIILNQPVLEYIEDEGIDYLVDYDTHDLSIVPGKKWNPKRLFRGYIPRDRLKLVRREPQGGRNPQTLYVFKVRPKRGSNRTRKRPMKQSSLSGEKRHPSGRWREYRTHRFNDNLTDDQQKTIRQLESIGYLSGSSEAPGFSNVTFHAKEHTYQGLNFYTSGHAPEAVLMDMNGRILHTWRYDFSDVWPDYPISDYDTNRDFWRRAYLYENGDVLAIYEGLGIIKIDKNSNLIWGNPCRAHHDLDVLPNGDIYVLTREAGLVPRVSANNPILEDFISILDTNGNEKNRISLLECFENSNEYGSLWERRRKEDSSLQKVYAKGAGDIFHTNTLHVLRHHTLNHLSAFKRGNILTSILQMNAIAVVNLDQITVTWAYQGDFKKQHDPQILENGNLLLFDNQGRAGRSRIIEFDLSSMKKEWMYEGTGEQPFYSKTCGTCQRLPNGNTLVTESDAGRAFEVTPDKTIVWEFYNPHRAGKRKEFIATLFEVIRLESDFPIAWIQGKHVK